MQSPYHSTSPFGNHSDPFQSISPWASEGQPKGSPPTTATKNNWSDTYTPDPPAAATSATNSAAAATRPALSPSAQSMEQSIEQGWYASALGSGSGSGFGGGGGATAYDDRGFGESDWGQPSVPTQPQRHQRQYSQYGSPYQQNTEPRNVYGEAQHERPPQPQPAFSSPQPSSQPRPSEPSSQSISYQGGASALPGPLQSQEIPDQQNRGQAQTYGQPPSQAFARAQQPPCKFTRLYLCADFAQRFCWTVDQATHSPFARPFSDAGNKPYIKPQTVRRALLM